MQHRAWSQRGPRPPRAAPRSARSAAAKGEGSAGETLRVDGDGDRERHRVDKLAALALAVKRACAVRDAVLVDEVHRGDEGSIAARDARDNRPRRPREERSYPMRAATTRRSACSSGTSRRRSRVSIRASTSASRDNACPAMPGPRRRWQSRDARRDDTRAAPAAGPVTLCSRFELRDPAQPTRSAPRGEARRLHRRRVAKRFGSDEELERALRALLEASDHVRKTARGKAQGARIGRPQGLGPAERARRGGRDSKSRGDAPCNVVRWQGEGKAGRYAGDCSPERERKDGWSVSY